MASMAMSPCSTSGRVSAHGRAQHTSGFIGCGGRPVQQRKWRFECAAEPAGTNASGSAPAPAQPAEDLSKAAILARIAKAKKYKEAGGEGGSSGAATTASEPPPPPLPSLIPGRAPVDWSAVESFIGSGGKQGNAMDGLPVPQASGGPLSEEEKAAQAARAARFEAAKDKMSDEYTPIDKDNASYVNMIMTANFGNGRGSAATPATALQTVLADTTTNGLADGLDASTMTAEQYTTAKEARLRQLGVEILTVDPSYRPNLPAYTPPIPGQEHEAPPPRPPSLGDSGEAGQGGGIVTTVRNRDAAAALFARTKPRTLEGNPAERMTEGLDLQGTGAIGWAAPAAPPTTPGGPQPDGQQGEGGGRAGESYKPTVSTWGVFPRPKDISAAFGGGRTIKPGQELETEEQRAARQKAYDDALKAYKAKMGLVVDPEKEEAAQALYEEGMVLFKAANLQDAYFKFKDALDLVPIKSRVGGLAGLQAAIILDSQGQSAEAQKLYKRLQGHAVAAVARKAKQMMFGFKAAAFLKADTISYAVRKGDYDKYFRQGADRNTVWVPTEEEREEAERKARIAALIAVVVILGPVGLLCGLIARQQGLF